MAEKHLGKQKPRYLFFLNPYSDVRFTTCPKCHGKTKLRKYPLFIHVDPHNPLVINKSCRYCPYCDLIIAHKDEIEQELVIVFTERKPELIGNGYLIIGTVDRPDWQKSMQTPFSIPEMIACLHDFKKVLTFEAVGGWGRW